MCGIEANASLELRFQRSLGKTTFPWGVAPGFYEPAPLALKHIQRGAFDAT
jgi:hypothetical protein